MPLSPNWKKAKSDSHLSAISHVFPLDSIIPIRYIINTKSVGTAVLNSPTQVARVAQLVEQRIENPRVGGSNPPPGTTFSHDTHVFSVTPYYKDYTA